MSVTERYLGQIDFDGTDGVCRQLNPEFPALESRFEGRRLYLLRICKRVVVSDALRPEPPACCDSWRMWV
jgi:hypothetical protein